jgi:hypothetical protein
VLERVANEGARTIPGREHGGNCDVSCELSFSLVDARNYRSRIYRGMRIYGHGSYTNAFEEDLAATSLFSLKEQISQLAISIFLRLVREMCAHRSNAILRAM